MERGTVEGEAVEFNEGTSTHPILLEPKPLESRMAAKAAEAVTFTMRRTGEKWTLSPRRRDVHSVSFVFWIMLGLRICIRDSYIHRIITTERRRG